LARVVINRWVHLILRPGIVLSVTATLEKPNVFANWCSVSEATSLSNAARRASRLNLRSDSSGVAIISAAFVSPCVNASAPSETLSLATIDRDRFLSSSRASSFHPLEQDRIRRDDNRAGCHSVARTTPAAARSRTRGRARPPR